LISFANTKTFVNISRYAGDVHATRIIPTMVYSRNKACAKVSQFTVILMDSYLPPETLDL